MIFDAEGALAEALESTETLKWTTVLLIAKINTSNAAEGDDCPALGDVMIILGHFCKLEALLIKVKEHCKRTRVNGPRNR